MITELPESSVRNDSADGTTKNNNENGARIHALIIVENLPVPFDTRVWKQAQALNENGYGVFVICPKGLGFDKTYEEIDGIRVYRHPMPKGGKGAAGYAIEYTSALFWEFLYSWWIFCRYGFRVIQGCNPPDTIFIIAAPFKLFGVRYIFDHHDVCPELYEAKFGKRGLMYKIQTWLERLTFKTCDVALATNNSYRDIAVTRGGLADEDVFVVRNGPDIDRFRLVAPNVKYKNGKRYLVGYVGTMAAYEGLDTLLHVASRVRDLGRHDVQFVCVGGGPELEDLRAMTTEMGLDNTVDFPGFLFGNELLECLSTTDICVNPDGINAKNDMSTMIKIMEYMALEKPIVQFDLREGRYSAQESSLYAKDSIDDFAAKVVWLLDHPEERRKMGKLGRKRVQESLAWQYSIPHLLSAYAQAAAK